MKKLIAFLLSLLLMASPAWAGASLSYNATTSYVDAGSASTVDDLGSLTFVMWVYPLSAGEGNFGRFISKRGSLAALQGWNLAFNGATPTVAFLADTDGTDVSAISSTTFSTNAWQSVAVTWDGTSAGTGIHIYKNLAEVSYASQNGTGNVLTDAANSLTIGNLSSAAERTFDGNIAYTQVFDHVLTFQEIIEATYRPGSIRNGLVVYHAGFTTTDTDLSGQGNSLTASNTTVSALGPPVLLTGGAQ
jgi:hypothetical protein